MRTLISIGDVRHDAVGKGPMAGQACSMADAAMIRTEDGREHVVRVFAYGDSRALLGHSGLPKAA